MPLAPFFLVFAPQIRLHRKIQGCLEMKTGTGLKDIEFVEEWEWRRRSSTEGGKRHKCEVKKANVRRGPIKNLC